MRDQIKLSFSPDLSLNAEGKHVRDGLSTALLLGDNLWLSCDERTTVERLTRLPDGSFGNHYSFDVHNYLDLPAKNKSEIDIEGMGMADHYLWLIGSHSLKRKKPKRPDSIKKQIERLSEIKSDPNRYLLARIPMLQDPATGEYTLYKEVADPDHPSSMCWWYSIVRRMLVRLGRTMCRQTFYGSRNSLRWLANWYLWQGRR